MFKNKVYILIYLSIVLPTFVWGAALERYTVPEQKKSGYTTPPKTAVSESVYDDFRNQIRNYSQAEKERMIRYYLRKKNEASEERKFDAKAHYERLIGILNSN